MTEPTRAAPVRAVAPDPWLQAWGGLRARRIGLVAACATFLALAWESTGAGLVLGALGLLAALHALRSWRCPRCGESFAGARGRWFALACASCGLPEFAAPEVVAEAPGALAPDAQTLSPRFRRFLAGSQLLGGALVLTIAATNRLPWIAGGVVEALGVASGLAGVWLWRDDARGYRYSRVLHALQLVKVQAAGVVYVVSAGFHVLFWQSDRAAGVEPGVAGNLALAVGASVPRLVAVNLFSLAALVLLLRARPSATSAVAAER